MDQPKETANKAKQEESTAIRGESRVRNIIMHLLAHREFYEPIDRYKPTEELVEAARAVLPRS